MSPAARCLVNRPVADFEKMKAAPRLQWPPIGSFAVYTSRRPSPGTRSDTMQALAIGAGFQPIVAELTDALHAPVAGRVPLALGCATGPRQRLFERLALGRLDIVVDREPDWPERDRFDYRPLCREPIGVMVDRRHPLATHAFVAMRDLADFPLLVASDDAVVAAGIERQLSTEGAVDGIDPVPLSLGAGVAPSLGLSPLVAPYACVAERIHRGELVPLPTERLLEPLTLGVFSRRRALPHTILDPVIASLVAALRSSRVGPASLRRTFHL